MCRCRNGLMCSCEVLNIILHPEPLPMNGNFTIRLACEADVPALELLIPLSARRLQLPYYSPSQIEAALGPVFGVDRQLIEDGTCFVAEHPGGIAGCGSWSRRRSVFGSDRGRMAVDDALTPGRDPARIRAFFVHPECARRGIGRAILRACEQALCAAHFTDAILVATLAGEPLYAAEGYSVEQRYDISLPDGNTLPAVRMRKSFDHRSH